MFSVPEELPVKTTTAALRPLVSSSDEARITIDELRSLVSTPEDLHMNLPTLQRVEALDHNNDGIVDDQIETLRFISLSASPVALQSVDLGHNRLGNVGAIALARLLQASASKLSNLNALDLFENGIRDEGDPGRGGGGKLVASHERHAARQRHLGDGATAMWREILTIRILKERLPDESASMGFAELVKRQVELVKANHVAAVAEKLEPLIVFIKRVIWKLVTREGMAGW